jgi:hypothetical protein
MYSLLKKIGFYADGFLHARILVNMMVVSLHRNRGYCAAIPISVSLPRKAPDSSSISRLWKYCGLWLHVRARLGLSDRCYFRSALICRVLRRGGIDARLNFGTMKDVGPCESGWHYTGHCWVSCGEEIGQSSYPFVIQYPFKGAV